MSDLVPHTQCAHHNLDSIFYLHLPCLDYGALVWHEMGLIFAAAVAAAFLALLSWGYTVWEGKKVRLSQHSGCVLQRLDVAGGKGRSLGHVGR